MMRRAGICVTSTAAALALMLTGPPLADAAFPGKNGRIAFTCRIDGNDEICTVRRGGGRLRNLTESETVEREPAFSPKGRRIAFVRCDGDCDVFVMRADGSGERQVTELSGLVGDPSFSRDGERIAFHHFVPGDGFEIHTVRTDGTGLQRLTETATLSLGNLDPAWSPRGKRIAFTSTVSGNGDIHTIRRNGTGERQLTRSEANDDGEPDWSPDGERIAFTRSRSTSDGPGPPNVFVMRADGRPKRSLTRDPEREESAPAFSPNGRRIAFQTFQPLTQNDIFTMRARDGRKRNRILRDPRSDFEPSWQSK